MEGYTCLLENFSQRAAKARDDIAKIDNIVVGRSCNRRHDPPVGHNRVLIGIDNEDEPNASCQVFGDLGSHFGGRVLERNDFDHKIGRALEESSWIGWWQPIRPDERNVWSSDRVRIRCEPESNPDQDDTELFGSDIPIEEGSEPDDHLAVLVPDWAQANEPPLDELVPIVVVPDSLELFGRDEIRHL
jgi:hypothetical protein